MSTCSNCGSPMTTGTSELKFNRNGMSVQVKNVPAFLCTQCDHKTLNASVSLYLDRIIQAIYATEQPIRVRELVLEAA